jgi:cell division protein FtsB
LVPFRLFSPGRIVLFTTLAVAAYLLVSAGGNVLHSYRLADDEAQLRQEIEQLTQDKGQLEQVRDYLRTDEFVEFMARRTFGLVKPGEKLVVVSAPEPVETPLPDEPGEAWWKRLFGGP